MQTLSIGFFSLFFFAVVPAIADTKCSNADGSLQYEHKNLVGGAPPREGSIAQTITIFVQGKPVSESIVFIGLEPKLGPVSPIFSELQDLQTQTHPYGEIRTFSALLTLEKNPSWTGDFPELAKAVFDYVICRTESFARP